MATNRTHPERRRALTALALAALLGVASCTTEEKKEDGTPAARLCESSLDADAVRALEALSRDQLFRGEQGPSFHTAVGRLRQYADVSGSRSSVCRVHAARDKGDTPLFDIEFVRPAAEAKWPEKLEPKQSLYHVGLFGDADENNAFLAFRCARGLGRNGPSTVAGSLDLSPKKDAYRLEGAERSRALMTVLHSAARMLARQLGCGDEAQLPVTLPEPSDPAEYRKPQ